MRIREGAPRKVKNVRLPKSVCPSHYSVTLEPDLERFTFNGFVDITIDVQQPTKEIMLHAQELAIASVEFKNGAAALKPISIEIDVKEERVTFHFEEELPIGNAHLEITFYGVLNDQMSGFYRSTYEVNGKKKFMATTQFEDTDARRAFPCWDEPALKARFDVTLVVPAELTALSNMPAVSAEIVGEKKSIRYDTTPVMSTYLLAFVIAELEYLETELENGTKIRVYTTPGKKEQGQFALETGAKVLHFYNEYFGIPYPLPKLDMVAIPDFAAGAMENWGLITYREIALLIDPENSPASMKQRVAIVVAHEISHQWFGNLVTMEWWTQLWLNEGFASWMEYLAVDHVYPEMKVWEQFVADDHATALSDDALRSTHPVEIVIHHPSEIRQTFDSISYSKGAVIVRMIHEFLGKEAFQRGLRNYLSRFAYKNAATEDLWQALEEASCKPVRRIMNTWTKQSGYPLISCAGISRDKSGVHVELSQRRFLSSGVSLLPEEDKQTWDIALPFAVKSGGATTTESILFTGKKQNMPLILAPRKAKDWCKFNVGQIALARVNYSKELWGRLQDAVAAGEISTIDRFGLASDLNAFVRAGIAPATQLLEFVEAFKEESEYIVWSKIIGGVGSAGSILPDESAAQKNLYRFGREILLPITTKIGWDQRAGDSHLDVLLRGMVLETIGSFEHEETVAEARLRFKGYLEDQKNLNPNLRGMVYRLVARNGDEEMFDTLVDCYRKAARQEEKVRFLVSLGSFRNKTLLQRALDFSFSQDVRPQDSAYLVGQVAGNMKGDELAWQFMQKNWNEMKRRYEGSIMMFSHIVEDVVSAFDSEEKAQEIEAFFAKNSLPGVSQALSRGLERVRTQAAHVKRNRKAVVNWLAARYE